MTRTLRGTPGNDALHGSLDTENWFVEVGSGRDVLTGSNRSDTFTLTVDQWTDIVDGGGGIDTVDYTYADRALTIDLNNGLTIARFYGEAVQLPGPGGGYIEKHADVKVTELHNVENVIGSRLGDTILGDHRDNVIEGGAGADVINGGGGLDTASYAHSSEGVKVDLSWQDVGLLGRAYGGDGTGDLLKSIENVIGSQHSDVMIGDRGANVFTGGAGVDTFVFGRNIGHDTITDFDASGKDHDVIRLEGVFDSWHELRSHLFDTGDDVLIRIDDHNSITLENVNFHQLDASDFYFG